MEISQHCTFCDHKEFDFTTGNLCGITGKKADFIRKCPKIDFNVNAKNEIARINFEYKSIQDEKRSILWHLILYSIIGIAIILADIYLTDSIFSTGFANEVSMRTYWVVGGSLLVLAGGVSLIRHAFMPYIRYTNANSATKSQKKRMDDLLALYDYDYKINFEQENPEIAVKLFRSKRPI